MSTSNDRSAAMADGRRADSQRRRQRVAKALQTATASGRRGQNLGDRPYGWRRPLVLLPAPAPRPADQVQAAAIEPRDGVGPAASRASFQADLANSQDRCKRLADHISLLEKRLSAAIGEEVWHRSGLGSSIDVEDLHRQIVTLEETNVDLRLKMEDLEEELAAARANNRELMTQFNAKGRTPR